MILFAFALLLLQGISQAVKALATLRGLEPAEVAAPPDAEVKL